MTQIIPIFAYALWVACSFAFILFVPSADAKAFLSIYAAGSFAASLFSIPIYTSWKNRIFDVLFAVVCVLSIAGVGLGYSAQLYVMSAVALNIVDYSVAQSKNQNAVVFMRLTIGLSALALFFGFEFGLSFRLFLCAAAIIWSTFHKDYSKGDGKWFDFRKAHLTFITCCLYYIPLSLIPYMSDRAVRFVYICYAISGSIILKIQDYIIKLNVSRGTGPSRTSRKNYFIICGATIAGLALTLCYVNPWLTILCVPIIGLVATIWIVDNVSWG